MSQQNKKDMKVLHVAPEMAPFTKVGGLADVLSSLPVALSRSGTDARVLIPGFPGIFDKAEEKGYRVTRIRRNINISINWRVYSARLWKIQYGHIPVYVLDNHDIFAEPGIYPGKLDQNTVLPFSFLSFAAHELGHAISWEPDILHLHDWSTSLAAIAGKWHPFYGKGDRHCRTIFTIHNLAHQGILPPGVLEGWGMKRAFNIDCLEFYGSVNLMKGAIITSDAITTVSPRYADEIGTTSMGMGLEGVIQDNRDKVFGILNGLDTEYWNPSKDDMIPSAYQAGDLAGKRICRSALMDETGIHDDGGPLITMVTRLYRQKGIELVLENIEQILQRGARIFILGSGEKALEEALAEKTRAHPHKMAFTKGYNEPLAHLAYAAGDMFLMPSLFEPCGLSQLIALRYGTVPVVRSTGGLADTIIDADYSPKGYGFTFTEFSSSSMLKTVKRAISSFKNRERWNIIVDKCMEMDFSWDRSAPEYEALYSRILNHETQENRPF